MTFGVLVVHIFMVDDFLFLTHFLPSLGICCSPHSHCDKYGGTVAEPRPDFCISVRIVDIQKHGCMSFCRGQPDPQCLGPCQFTAVYLHNASSVALPAPQASSNLHS